MINVKHKTIKIKEDYRLIAISDIHGHLDEFVDLLDSMNYKVGKDYLVIIGDYVEKGDQVLELMDLIEKLSKYPRVYILLGNCEWAMEAMMTIPELAKEIPTYFKRVPRNGAIRTLYHQEKLYDGHESTLGIQRVLESKLHKHIKFIRTLPTTLKINDFLFVHAGLETRDNYKECGLSSYLEMQGFLNMGHPYKETVIVGHIPTSNYRYTINNDILIDEEKRIICIDGGLGVKSIAQLNALEIISKDNEISYHKHYRQPLPKAKILKDVQGNDLYHKISFPHFKVELIKKGNSFSLCKQEEEFYIKNEYLYKRNNEYYCLDDYTDHFIEAKKETIVSVIFKFDDYVLVRHGHDIGWIEESKVKMLHEN